MFLQGRGDFLLAHLRVEVLEVCRQHRRLRGGAHERALAGGDAFFVLFEAVDVASRELEVVLELGRCERVEVIQLEVFEYRR